MASMKILSILPSALLSAASLNGPLPVNAFVRHGNVIRPIIRIRQRRQFCSASVQGGDFLPHNDVSLDPQNDEDGDNDKPFFRIYYNDVYEVDLPPRHRFPMKKYSQVRKQVQKWIGDLPREEQDLVQCGKVVL